MRSCAWIGLLFTALVPMGAAAPTPPAIDSAALLKRLSADDPNDRKAAESAITDMKAAGLPVIDQAMASADPFVRASAAYLLSRTGPEVNTEPQLRRLVQDPHWMVRLHAALSFGRLGKLEEASVDLLVAAMGDDIRGVRRAAVWAIRRAGEGATPPLTRGLKHENPAVREQSTMMLRGVQPSARNVRWAREQSHHQAETIQRPTTQESK